MKKKILIIGEKSFIGNNLFNYFKKKLTVKKISYNKFNQLKIKYINRYTHVINCSLNPLYTKKKYNKKYDIDLKIAKKLKNSVCKFIFLSSRHVYAPKDNIKELFKEKPISQYGKNKKITEDLLFKNLRNNLLILRIANIIGDRKIINSRKVHKTFIDIFFDNLKLGYVINNGKKYKDFLTIGQLSKIVIKLINVNAEGVFNVSAGKKIFLSKLINWLLKYNKTKTVIKNITKSERNKIENKSFYLNNSKLRKKINFNFRLDELKKECFKLSKNNLYEKK